jgi:signal transduction histidine kinase/ligand-binding sensor domain-containing protein
MLLRPDGGLKRFISLACALAVAVAHVAARADEASPWWAANLLHTGWTKKDGAPTGAGIVQDSKGMLWLLAQDGLFRFDGVRFERVDEIEGNKLLSPTINTMEVFGDTIWIGYRFGGISAFEHGKVRHYGEKEGVPARSILRMERSGDGTVWASTPGGVIWLDGGQWKPAEGLPRERFAFADTLSDGTLLIGFNDALYRSIPGTHRFRQVLQNKELISSEPGPDGKLFVMTRDHRVFLFDPKSETLAPMALSIPSADILSLHGDGHGGLWAITKAGLQLLDYSGIVRKTFAASQAATGNFFYQLLFDREGNLWFTTENGLDRISKGRVTTVDLPADRTPCQSVTAGGEGEIWLGCMPGNHFLGATAFYLDRQERLRDSPMQGTTTSVRAPDGSMWFGGPGHVWRKLGEKYQSWQTPEDFGPRPLQALAVDGRAVLWVAVAGKGVYTFKDGIWTAGGGNATLAQHPVITMDTDSQGRVWLGYPKNKIVRVDADGTTRQFGPEDGLAIGNVLSIRSRGDRHWFGGDNGVAYWDGKRFAPLEGEEGGFTGICGIAETAGGELWLHGRDGLMRIGADQITKLRQGQASTVRSEHFDYRDGYLGTAELLKPCLAEAQDGRLWYVTAASVGWIDPANIRRNALAPTPQVLALRSDTTPYALGAGLKLPPGTENLQFDFTAAAMTIPERARFRFRLLGAEDQWREAGGRRQAFYTKLGPGSYRFEVLASNEDGVWSAEPATFEFRIEPTFIQTIWFKLACAGAAFLGVYLLLVWRVKVATARVIERIRERAQERTRIAQTLHDTFLQSVAALILRFERIKATLAPDDPARREIDKALDSADAVLAEGRDQVFGLRAGAVPRGDILLALQEIGPSMSEQHNVGVELRTRGDIRRLDPLVQEEVYAIAREALSNACRHSGSDKVLVELRYEHDSFQLSVIDSGRGVDREVLGRGKPGHWGLAGMRERALRAGGELAITSRGGQGTQVSLTVPGESAYAGAVEVL